MQGRDSLQGDDDWFEERQLDLINTMNELLGVVGRLETVRSLGMPDSDDWFWEAENGGLPKARIWNNSNGFRDRS